MFLTTNFTIRCNAKPISKTFFFLPNFNIWNQTNDKSTYQYKKAIDLRRPKIWYDYATVVLITFDDYQNARRFVCHQCAIIKMISHMPKWRLSLIWYVCIFIILLDTWYLHILEKKKQNQIKLSRNMQPIL